MVGRPAKTGLFPNRVRMIRLKRDMSLQTLSDVTGFSVSALHRLETGETQIKQGHLAPIAAALDIDADELLFDPNRRPVQIIGYVGAGAEVFPLDELPRWEGDHEVDCPRDLNPDDTEALIVEGDSMLPIEPRSVVFVTRSRPSTPDDVLGKLCVVELADGRRLVKQVRRGYQKGRFNLISTNAAPIEDVEIERAARVRAIIPPAVN